MATSINLEHVLHGQLLALSKRDLLVESPDKFVPRTKLNVGYIVSAVIFNEAGKVLLVQEAKRSCRGLWYLPAGRMEPGEDLTEACQREVHEEAGYQCQPTTLLNVESNSSLWFRFNFAAVVTGGQLKTTAEADEESLQADWFSREELGQLSLRCKDILSVIDLGISYHTTDIASKHAPLLPHVVAHSRIVCKYVFYQAVNDGQYYVMYHVIGKEHGLPAIVLRPSDYNIYSTTGRLLREIIKMKDADNKILPHFKGILSLEHSGKPKYEHDGFCMTLLVELRMSCAASPQLFKLKSKLQWLELSGDEKQLLVTRVPELGSVALSCQ